MGVTIKDIGAESGGLLFYGFESIKWDRKYKRGSSEADIGDCQGDGVCS